MCYLSRWNCYDWWRIFIVSNLIGDRIFLQSKPQNSIACHQTLVQSLSTRQYVLPMHIFEFTQMLAELGINAHIVYCTTMAILKFLLINDLILLLLIGWYAFQVYLKLRNNKSCCKNKIFWAFIPLPLDLLIMKDWYNV